MALNIEPAKELDDRDELNDDAGVEYLGIVPNELAELGSRDAELLKVSKDRDNVFADAAGEDQGVGVEVIHSKAEAVEELDALAHDVNGGGELKGLELIGDDADGLEIIRDDNPGDKALLAALDDAPGH